MAAQNSQTGGAEGAQGWRTHRVLAQPPATGCGIIAGGSLSPILGALYLTPLDAAMQRRQRAGSLVGYVRYMDDFVLLARTRWQLRRAIAEVHAVIAPLGLRLHPGKRYIGRLGAPGSGRGFDFLGYRFERGRRLRPSRESLRRLRERARRLHEHGGDDERLRLYAERWWMWIHAGLGEGRASMASRKGGLKRHRREVLRYLQYRRSRDGDGLERCPAERRDGERRGIELCEFEFRERGWAVR